MNIEPASPTRTVDYLWNILTDSRHELSYRLQLAWSEVKRQVDQVLGVKN
jgi:hypothetical protein